MPVVQSAESRWRASLSNPNLPKCQQFLHQNQRIIRGRQDHARSNAATSRDGNPSLWCAAEALNHYRCPSFCNASAVGGTSLLLTIRAVRLVAACLMPLLAIGSAAAQNTAPGRQAAPRPASRTAPAANAAVIQSIQVEGNQRIEEGTIRSYLLVQPGDRFDPDRTDRSLKTLYATGLFQDVRLGRVGDTLVVRVVENPIVNRVAYEGNHKLTDDQLRPELQLRPRSVFTPALAESDRCVSSACTPSVATMTRLSSPR